MSSTEIISDEEVAALGEGRLTPAEAAELVRRMEHDPDARESLAMLFPKVFRRYFANVPRRHMPCPAIPVFSTPPPGTRPVQPETDLVSAVDGVRTLRAAGRNVFLVATDAHRWRIWEVP